MGGREGGHSGLSVFVKAHELPLAIKLCRVCVGLGGAVDDDATSADSLSLCCLLYVGRPLISPAHTVHHFSTLHHPPPPPSPPHHNPEHHHPCDRACMHSPPVWWECRQRGLSKVVKLCWGADAHT